MKQKLYSIGVILIFSICLYLFSTLNRSSLLFESNRTISNAKDLSTNLKIGLNRQNQKDSFLFDTYIQNPANLELYLRASLLNSNDNTVELSKLYSRLLKIRPTWPYYYSGLVQINQLSKTFNKGDIDNAIKNGKFERTVTLSLAEVLFHDWEKIETRTRLSILNHLSVQSESIIALTVNISSKFAKLYQYCDFLYEKNHVEYAACKQNYWQPLSD